MQSLSLWCDVVGLDKDQESVSAEHQCHGQGDRLTFYEPSAALAFLT